MNTPLPIPAPASANLQPAAPAAESPAEIFDRYADSIIGCFEHLFDAVEVHGVRNFASGTDSATCYEIDNATPTSFSVYVHVKEGGLDCVGDFGKYEDAAQYGAEVGAQYGWPVRTYVRHQVSTASVAPLQ